MKNNIVKGASILTVVLMFGMMLTPVLGVPIPPHNRWGQAYDGAGLMGAGETLTVWINGTSYGTFDTLASGWFSLDCEGDGDNPDTTPDGVKTGGYIGDPMYYVHGDLTSASGGTFFAETDAFEVGGVTGGDLTYAPAQPALLKISNVASQANVPSGIDDYVVIYNPTGAPVDLFGYSLSIADGAPFPIAAVCPDSVNPVLPGTWAAIDLTGLLSTTGNSITLRETGGFIVDRVEYGGIGAEPENTDMPNAPNPAFGEEISRVPTLDFDTNDCNVDFTIIVPAVDHGGIFTTATALGPIGTGGNMIDITYAFTQFPVSVDIYYTVDFNVTWNVLGNDASVDGLFAAVDLDGLAGPNTYQWICNAAPPGDDAVGVPAGGTPAEAGMYIYSGAEKVAAATGLTIAKTGANDLTLTWTNPTASDFWDIYGGSDKFDVRNPANLLGTVPDGTGTYLDGGAQNDGNEWYYVVVGRGSLGTEAANSTMVFKVINTLYGNAPASGLPNINFVTLPWDTSYYPDAFAIITDIEGGTAPTDHSFIDAINYWDATSQSFSSSAYWAPGPIPPMGWYNNYALNSGDGIAIVMTNTGAAWTYDWVMIGADVVAVRDMNGNDPASGLPNINFVSVPITGNYADAFAVITDIEGGTAPTDHSFIDAVNLWDPQSQSFSSSAYWAPGPIPPMGWYNNYGIDAAEDGIAIVLTDTGAPWVYPWTVSLITPVV